MWERIIDRYGLPVAFLVVVLLAVYFASRYVVIPLINRFMTTIEQQLTEAREARRHDSEKFLERLEQRDEVQREMAGALRELTDKIEGLSSSRGRK